MSEYSCTVACVTYQYENASLDRTLECLLLALDKVKNVSKVTIFLIDNGPGKYTEQFLKKLLEYVGNCNYRRLRVFSGHGNIGFGSGHNLVIREIESDFHLILNPDAFLDDSVLSVGIDYLANNPDVALVTPQTLGENGDIQFTAKRYPNLLVLLLRAFAPNLIKKPFRKLLDNYELKDKIPSNKPLDIDIASGCFMLARTSALKGIGGFDESFFMYFEDFDLSLRLREKYRIVYLPSMKIVHLGGKAARKGLKHIRYFSSSAFKFFNKHGWQFY